VWNTVIFQDNAFFNLFEKPADRTTNTEATALVDIRIESLDVARPIDFLIDQRTGRSNLFYFTGPRGIGSITSYKYPLGRNWTHGINHQSQGLRPTPGDQKYGSIGGSHIFG
jgi:hypothetical protein